MGYRCRRRGGPCGGRRPWLAQRPRIGRLGGVSAAAYALSYVFYTFTAFYALEHRTTDYATLIEDLGLAGLVAGVVFTLAGLGFGVAVWRARVFPRWTAVALMAGVVLVATTQALPNAVGVLAVATRDAAFAGMGWTLIHR